jgi:UDP-glucuronate decarboxylase
MLNSVIKEDIDKIVEELREDLKKFEGKTVFITGASGLIASYIIDTLVSFNTMSKNPCKIIAVTKNPITEKSRLHHLINNSNVIFLRQDVGKNFSIIGKPDIIIHAASRANPTAFLKDPLDTIDANVNGTRKILDYAAKNKLEQFIFFSSAEIYGNPHPDFIPTKENYNGNVDCTHPYACYIESKRISETLCSIFFRNFGVPSKMLRILLAYGPGIKNDGKVISDFFDRAINKKEITLKDSGQSRRSFCYISDVTRAIFKIIFNGKAGEAYNIGNDLEENNTSILDLAKQISKISGEGIEVKPNPEAQQNIKDNRRVNIEKLRSLGFEPVVNLEEGLKRLRRYYHEENYL